MPPPATSDAVAIAEIEGPSDGSVLVTQTHTTSNGTNGDVENLNLEAFFAIASATATVPAVDPSFAQSTAQSEASIDSEVDQTNTNTGSGSAGPCSFRGSSSIRRT